MLHPPRTALELYKILPEGTQCELINNQIIMSPSAKWKHQDIVKKILVALDNYLKKNPAGIVLSDVDIYLNEANVYRPDIMVITNNQLHILGDDGYIHGAPELVIEVLSQGTHKYDKKEKKEMYAKCGVKEYWLVEPTTLQCEGFVAEDNKFQPLPSSEKKFKIQVLNLSIRLES